MNAIEVVQRYIKAWNGRDADALVALFAEGGTYRGPRVDHDLTGQAIGNYAKTVWATFPDVTLELISVSQTGPGQVAYQWLLRGTNSGPLILIDGSAATGRTVTVLGNDVMQVEGEKIRSVEVNYNRQAVDDQLRGTAP
jgi:steroid delta-isomerase-like uncharacterized protein